MSIYRDISISISIYIERESVLLVTSKYNNTKFPDLTELLVSVFLPGESQGWWSMVGCRLWGRTESDITEVT